MDVILAGAWYVLKANVNMAFLALLIMLIGSLLRAGWDSGHHR